MAGTAPDNGKRKADRQQVIDLSALSDGDDGDEAEVVDLTRDDEGFYLGA